ncbi:MAG: hypothetical protein H6R15_3888 [Proteobacteria bacterium]|nr:hypothetical protein [Pseudomonadota bacterium]
MNLQFLSAAIPALPPAESGRDGQVLGGARLGALAASGGPEWPWQGIAAPLLGGRHDAVEEIWRSDLPCTAGEFEGIAWRRAGSLLYGVIELAEDGFAAAPTATPLHMASREAYRRIFRLLASQGLPQLWRVWNYLGQINQESHGLERYRQFNIGRQEAFLEFARQATGNVPAACAIGLAGGPLSIAFLAGAQAAVPVENPRQVSAYNYPPEYGPRSPTFSRAALVYPPGQEILFVSGTASIVGHQTVHLGDVAGQCRESMVNIAAVVDAANRLCRSPAYCLNELSYRVYLRHAADFPEIREILAELTGGEAGIVYLQADICRHDLLLEIEAMASHTLGVA